ncbi:hypothetical protein [Streptomyces collinus]|uniref:hypothetical protein n=1 Tax=Streptomyces collinus TaxID=42684 RepID=UPI00331C1171
MSVTTDAHRWHRDVSSRHDHAYTYYRGNYRRHGSWDDEYRGWKHDGNYRYDRERSRYDHDGNRYDRNSYRSDHDSYRHDGDSNRHDGNRNR